MSLIDRDLKCNWHPCTQMKDCETMPPLPIVAASGCWVEQADGHRLFDASSSWWCKTLGHRHPDLMVALQAQSQRFDHVIFANTTYDTIVELSEKLKAHIPQASHVMYASDGSCAVEMALKLAVHAQALKGQKKRKRFASLSGAYHGETGLALAVSDCGLYCDPFAGILPEITALSPMPSVWGPEDPAWGDAKATWQIWQQQLDAYKDTLAAIIIEPIVQAANHMHLYSPDVLKYLAAWAKDNGVYLISDEIMTGFWRTGKLWAYQHADITPDFVCLGKGLTGGTMPMSAMLTTSEVYDLCYDDYHTGKAFLHSHTHSGNALSAAVALASVNILFDDAWQARVAALHAQMRSGMQAIADKTGRLANVRGVGAVMAADLILSDEEAAMRMGHRISRCAMEKGVLLRPLGHTLYWVPPLIATDKEIQHLIEVTEVSIQSILK